MSWSSGFITELKKSVITPKYELVFHSHTTGPGGNYKIRGGYEPPQFGRKAAIKKDGPTIQGSSVIPGSWNVTFGGIDVPVVGDIRYLFPNIRRGAYASLFVELNGVKERVAFGALKSIGGIKGDWIFSFMDIVGSLASNCDGEINTTESLSLTNPIQFGKFFYRTGATTTTNATYTMGGSTISVSDTKNFEKSYAVNGLAKVDIAGHGEAYFEWTSKSTSSGSGTLTLTAASKGGTVIYPGSLALTNIPSGSTVTTLAKLEDTPWDIIPYLLFSYSGTRARAYDEYPKSWAAFGNFPNDLWDDVDAKRANFYIQSNPTTTAYKWLIPVEAPWESGFRTLTDMASQVGQWPIWRQNGMTYRFALSPNQQNILPVIKITDDDILRVDRQELFSMDTSEIYNGVEIVYGPGATEKTSQGFNSNRAPSIPFKSRKTIDSQKLYSPTSGSSAKDHMAKGDITRIIGWSTGSISTVSLAVGLEFARLCSGDFVEIDSKYILNTTSQPQDYWRKRRAMVVGVSYSFDTREVLIRVATYLQQW